MALQRPTRTIEIELPNGTTRPFTIYDNELSLQVTSECLSGMAYPTPPQLKTEDVKTIVDVGANIGSAAIWFHSRFPNANIHAFEPGDITSQILLKNAAGIPQIHLRSIGLSDGHKAAILFHAEQDAAMDSVIQPRDFCPSEETAEQCEPVVIEDAAAELKDLLPIDILKIDTEGSEVPILKKLAWGIRYSSRDDRPPGHFIDDVKVVHVEYHSEEDRRQIDEMLSQTHTLFHASTTRPHRGLLGYLRNDLLTQNDHNHKIG